jgi:RNA polymerase sigma-70 factor (ECF subfamily)
MKAVSDNVITTVLEDRVRYLAFLERRVGSRALAEDILQSALVKALERGGQIKSSDASKAWFYRLLRNAVADNYRYERTANRILEQWSREAPSNQYPLEPFELEGCSCIGGLLATLNSSGIRLLPTQIGIKNFMAGVS